MASSSPTVGPITSPLSSPEPATTTIATAVLPVAEPSSGATTQTSTTPSTTATTAALQPSTDSVVVVPESVAMFSDDGRTGAGGAVAVVDASDADGGGGSPAVIPAPLPAPAPAAASAPGPGPGPRPKRDRKPNKSKNNQQQPQPQHQQVPLTASSPASVAAAPSSLLLDDPAASGSTAVAITATANDSYANSKGSKNKKNTPKNQQQQQQQQQQQSNHGSKGVPSGAAGDVSVASRVNANVKPADNNSSNNKANHKNKDEDKNSDTAAPVAVRAAATLNHKKASDVAASSRSPAIVASGRSVPSAPAAAPNGKSEVPVCVPAAPPVTNKNKNTKNKTNNNTDVLFNGTSSNSPSPKVAWKASVSDAAAAIAGDDYFVAQSRALLSLVQKLDSDGATNSTTKSSYAATARAVLEQQYLQPLLPLSFQVTNGQVINAHRAQTSALDTVIVNANTFRLPPAIVAVNPATSVPTKAPPCAILAESVVAVLCVSDQLTKRSLEMMLRQMIRPFNRVAMGANSFDGPREVGGMLSHPLRVIFAFSSTLSLEQIYRLIDPNFYKRNNSSSSSSSVSGPSGGQPPSFELDLVCVLDRGVVASPGLLLNQTASAGQFARVESASAALALLTWTLSRRPVQQFNFAAYVASTLGIPVVPLVQHPSVSDREPSGTTKHTDAASATTASPASLGPVPLLTINQSSPLPPQFPSRLTPPRSEPWFHSSNKSSSGSSYSSATAAALVPALSRDEALLQHTQQDQLSQYQPLSHSQPASTAPQPQLHLPPHKPLAPPPNTLMATSMLGSTVAFAPATAAAAAPAPVSAPVSVTAPPAAPLATVVAHNKSSNTGGRGRNNTSSGQRGGRDRRNDRN